ncbi:hypothetical protein F383_18599 [Gossypium arboreum]|uniref:Uncharacterized protein n=1 Tax=Gossypium arboreum TaxID=29729 RepID=A0A0B0NNP6_GOSAR|nr:hypothetical protein F383_18599 [Gossypium arboreum]
MNRSNYDVRKPVRTIGIVRIHMS